MQKTGRLLPSQSNGSGRLKREEMHYSAVPILAVQHPLMMERAYGEVDCIMQHHATLSSFFGFENTDGVLKRARREQLP